MIETFIKAWETNKDKLQAYFETHTMGEYDSYRRIVHLIFDNVINPYMIDNRLKPFDLQKLTEIDDGQYQGTLLYLIPRNDYQPSAWEYIITCVEYGSCTVCDILQGIHCYDTDEYPDKDQLKSYMRLCLHIIQRCKYPYDINTHIPD